MRANRRTEGQRQIPDRPLPWILKIQGSGTAVSDPEGKQPRLAGLLHARILRQTLADV